MLLKHRLLGCPVDFQPSTSGPSLYRPLQDLFNLALREQIELPVLAQILDPYEVTLSEFLQIKRVSFAHVNGLLREPGANFLAFLRFLALFEPSF